MFYTYIVTTDNLTAVTLLFSDFIVSLFLLLSPCCSQTLLSYYSCCLFCLHCHCFTDETFNKWWHCDLTHHTCHINEVDALLMQSLTSYSLVVILKVLEHSLIISVSSLTVHKTLRWLRDCTGYWVSKWDE